MTAGLWSMQVLGYLLQTVPASKKIEKWCDSEENAGRDPFSLIEAVME